MILFQFNNGIMFNKDFVYKSDTSVMQIDFEDMIKPDRIDFAVCDWFAAFSDEKQFLTQPSERQIPSDLQLFSGWMLTRRGLSELYTRRVRGTDNDKERITVCYSISFGPGTKHARAYYSEYEYCASHALLFTTDVEQLVGALRMACPNMWPEGWVWYSFDDFYLMMDQKAETGSSKGWEKRRKNK